MKLVLFDIDDTLLDTGGAGKRALNLAFKEIFSIEDPMNGISMAGKTDQQIIRECLNNLGISSHSDETSSKLFDSYVRHLEIELQRAGAEGTRPKSLKPGVMDLLDFLLSTPQLRIGLLTGNIQEGAWIKLRSFSIHRYFSFGAFGSDHADRNELLPFAVKMYNNISGIQVNYRDCVVVGDTPLDINCAKPYGAYSMAVATGSYSAPELESAGADSVLETLPSGEKFLSLISY